LPRAEHLFTIIASAILTIQLRRSLRMRGLAVGPQQRLDDAFVVPLAFHPLVVSNGRTRGSQWNEIPPGCNALVGGTRCDFEEPRLVSPHLEEGPRY
jgi:hypothetical protein